MVKVSIQPQTELAARRQENDIARWKFFLLLQAHSWLRDLTFHRQTLRSPYLPWWRTCCRRSICTPVVNTIVRVIRWILVDMVSNSLTQWQHMRHLEKASDTERTHGLLKLNDFVAAICLFPQGVSRPKTWRNQSTTSLEAKKLSWNTKRTWQPYYWAQAAFQIHLMSNVTVTDWSSVQIKDRLEMICLKNPAHSHGFLNDNLVVVFSFKWTFHHHLTVLTLSYLQDQFLVWMISAVRSPPTLVCGNALLMITIIYYSESSQSWLHF